MQQNNKGYVWSQDHIGSYVCVRVWWAANRFV